LSSTRYVFCIGFFVCSKKGLTKEDSAMFQGVQAQRRSERGFTLIEVMVVIIMIGILAAIAVPIYSGYVYRARASEGVVTMGAIKTYLTERANATGIWPTETEMNNEFNNFNELYYFAAPTLSVAAGKPILNTDGSYANAQIIVTMNINPANFGTRGDGTEDPPTLTLTIDLSDNATQKNSGWGGYVQSHWASHLPEPTA